MSGDEPSPLARWVATVAQASFLAEPFFGGEELANERQSRPICRLPPGEPSHRRVPQQSCCRLAGPAEYHRSPSRPAVGPAGSSDQPLSLRSLACFLNS